MKHPSAYLKMRVLGAIDFAPGKLDGGPLESGGPNDLLR